jgi:hypothetical protein
VSVVCNCCWSSPAQPFSGPSPTGIRIALYCLKFEIYSSWRDISCIYISQEQDGSVMLPALTVIRAGPRYEA